jgi:hypothetical protein
MIPPEPEPLPSTLPEPLIAVIDSCVFPRRDWLDPILRSARNGYVVPIWTPLIISEVTLPKSPGAMGGPHYDKSTRFAGQSRVRRGAT